jgi:hypothetical protein
LQLQETELFATPEPIGCLYLESFELVWFAVKFMAFVGLLDLQVSLCDLNPVLPKKRLASTALKGVISHDKLTLNAGKFKTMSSVSLGFPSAR